MRVVSFLALAAALTLACSTASTEEAPTQAGPGHPVHQIGADGAAATVLVAPSGKASVTKLAEGKNAFFATLRMDAGAKVPVHRDPTEEYLLITEGGGTLTLNGAQHELTVGSVVYMAANDEVSFVNGPAETVAYQIFAGPESAAKYGKWAPKTR